MDLHLTNKVALITGSTKGIGKAIAIEMAREGTDVVINGRKQPEVDTIVNEIKQQFPKTNPQGIAADLAVKADREKLFTEVSKVDILVNNMGIFQPMEYFDIDDATWEKFFQVNVLAGNALAKFYLPQMLKQDFGRIIFIASEEAIMPSGEIGRFTAFVASPDSSSFSGEALRVDGGLVPTIF